MILHLVIIYENKAIIYGSIIICNLLLQVFLSAFTVSSQFILTQQLEMQRAVQTHQASTFIHIITPINISYELVSTTK